MNDVTIDDASELDGIYARREMERLSLRGVEIAEVPAALGELTQLVDLSFDNCKVGPIDPRAFDAGKDKGPLEVRFMYSELDEDALFDQVLVHGQGNWRIKVFRGGNGYQQEPRWKLVSQLGDDGLGDATYRRQSFDLLCGREHALPKEPGHDELRLLDHKKKNIRELALAYLEPRFPDAVAEGVPAGAKLFAVGKPSYHDKGDLEAKLQKYGASLVRSEKDATHVLLMATPGDKLAVALGSNLPIVLEAHLKRALAKDAAPAPAATPKEAKNLEQLLLSVDEANQLLALEMVKSRELSGELLPLLMAVILFSESAAVRKRGRELIATHGSREMVAHFQGDKRNYVAITDGKKLGKLAVEFRNGFGLDPVLFTRALVRVLCARKDPSAYTVEPGLIAALGYPENERVVFGYLSSMTNVCLPSTKKRLPAGLSALKSLERLRIPSGTLTSAENMEELAGLSRPFILEIWVKAVNLQLLAPLSKVVSALHFRGSWSELSDVSPLRDWKTLQGVNLEDTGVTDVSPLSDIPMSWLSISNTNVTSVAPIAKMKSLTSLNVQRIPATDIAELAVLSNLTSLNISFTSQTDLRPFRALTKLRILEAWGVPVKSVEPLVGLPLESLVLSYTKVPDLMPLAQIPTLTSLTLIGVEVPKATLAALQKALPSLYIRQ